MVFLSVIYIDHLELTLLKNKSMKVIHFTNVFFAILYTPFTLMSIIHMLSIVAKLIPLHRVKNYIYLYSVKYSPCQKCLK